MSQPLAPSVRALTLVTRTRKTASAICVRSRTRLSCIGWASRSMP
jgi:hypothetical protein